MIPLPAKLVLALAVVSSPTRSPCCTILELKPFPKGASAQISALSAYPDSADICGNYQGRLFHKFKRAQDWLPSNIEFLSAGLNGPPSCISWGGQDEFRLDAFYECTEG